MVEKRDLLEKKRKSFLVWGRLVFLRVKLVLNRGIFPCPEENLE